MSIALLILRLALGSIMFAHGAQKVLGWFGGPGPQGVVGFMGQMGIPAPLAWLAMLVELVGGIFVILGVFGRLSALGFAVVMLVAMFTVHMKNGFFMGERPGIEFTLILFATSVAIAIMGPGRYALAPDLETRLFRRSSAPRAVPRHA